MPARRSPRSPGLEGDEFEAAFQRVLEQYGFRGVNEWEVASPSWEIRARVLRRAVDAVRAGGAPARSRQRLARGRARTFDADRRANHVPGTRPVARALRGLDAHSRTDQGHMRADHQRDAARRARDRSTPGRRRQARISRPDLLPDVRRAHCSCGSRAPSTSHRCTRERRRNPSWSGTRSRCSPSPVRFRRSSSGRSSRAATPRDDDVCEVIGAAGSPGYATGRARVVPDAYADEPTAARRGAGRPDHRPGLDAAVRRRGRCRGRNGRRAQPHDDRARAISASRPSSAQWAQPR